jgi:hypothetical protein
MQCKSHNQICPLSLSLSLHSEGCEWHTFKDWIKEDIRQILIETHELPLPLQNRPTEFGLIPQMGATEYFDSFEENGFVMFAKEINSPNWDGIGGRCSEWSYIKMSPEFLDMRNSKKHQTHNRNLNAAALRQARVRDPTARLRSAATRASPKRFQAPTTPTTSQANALGFGLIN